jgi:hypothetical protein
MPLERYMRLAQLLADKNPKLRDIDPILGSISGWFFLNDEYAIELSHAIDAALPESDMDEDTEYHLLGMRQVVQGGSIVIG